MYNRYLTEAAEQPTANTAAAQSVPSDHSVSPPAAPALSGLTHGLAGRLQNIKLDMDTIIVLAIVWFLLSDSGEIDWDQLLLIGILLLLGL